MTSSTLRQGGEGARGAVSLPRHPLDRVARGLARAGVLGTLERAGARGRGSLRVLSYHRIGEPAAERRFDPALISATPAQFAAQMALLRERYHPIGPRALLDALAGTRVLPRRAVLVTFDDAYRDFATHAMPVLERLEIPVVLFVPTGFVGSERHFWWDRLHYVVMHSERETLELPDGERLRLGEPSGRRDTFERLKRRVLALEPGAVDAFIDMLVDRLGVDAPAERMVLDWDELRALAARGVALAAHTRSHCNVARLAPGAALDEVVGSREDIRRESGQAWPLFAYPYGHATELNAGLVPMLAEAGFDAAMTMIEGHNRLGRTHPLLLRRLALGPGISTDGFRLALTGLYSLYFAARRRIAR